MPIIDPNCKRPKWSWIFSRAFAKPKRVVIIQTHVMDYRLPVFEELYRRCGGSFEVWSGIEAFSASSGQPANKYKWHRDLRNTFFINRKALWQSGHFVAALDADVCVVEFNPRILSTWIILIVRRVLGLRTALWGHLFPRAGVGARTTPVRLTMLALAREANLYTFSEGDAFRRRFPKLKSTVSANAVMWRRECFPGTVARRRRFLFVARMVEEKKPRLLLEGFALAAPFLPPDICLDFIGEGPCVEALVSRVNELGLQGRVNYHGALFRTEQLRPLYAEAVASCSPGYVGLSATQSFGFGVPMLIAKDERHSVEIELCKPEFNCRFFSSDTPRALADTILDFALRPPVWAIDHSAISNDLRERYTIDHMCDGFMAMFAPYVSQFAPTDSAKHVAIAWLGLPYYAARVIRESIRRHPDWKFTIISSRDVVPYDGIDAMLGNKVRWIAPDQPTSWAQLGETYPDIMLITSWPHSAYRMLAEEAKSQRNAQIVVMFDNYLRYTLKQIVGFFYYRLVLQRLFSAVWVPGEYSRRFARFLGATPDSVYTGLYAADHDIFVAPESDAKRDGLIFVGQFVERKGLHAVIDAAKVCRRIGRRLPISLYGCGPLETQLRGAGLRVEHFLQPPELAVAYRSSSALLLPSKIDHWGVVAHEAALCGCLLLVTRQCGCTFELVVHRLNGFIMENSSVSEILKAISWWESLKPQEIEIGRIESIQRAKSISPKGWADTLDVIVDRSF